MKKKELDLNFKIVKLNSKLEIVAEKKVDTKLSKLISDILDEIADAAEAEQEDVDKAKQMFEDELGLITPIVEVVLRLLTYDCVTINNNKVDVFGLGNVFEYDLDLKTQTVVELDLKNIGDYYPDIEREIKEIEKLVEQYLNMKDVNYMTFNVPLSAGVNETRDKTVTGGVVVDASTSKPLGKNALEIQVPLKYFVDTDSLGCSEGNLCLSSKKTNANLSSAIDSQNLFGKALSIKGVNQLYGFAGSDNVIDLVMNAYEKFNELIESVELDPEATARLAVSGYLKVYDKNDKLLFEHKSSEYLGFINTHIIEDYVVTLGVKFVIGNNVINIADFAEAEDGEERLINMLFNSTLSTEILVFDKSGNQLQTIKTKGIELVLVPTKRGFVTLGINDLVFNDYKSFIDGSLDETEMTEEEMIQYIKDKVTVKTNANVYQIVNDITVVDNSKGNVDVKEDAVEGEIVKINVKSKIGYVVDQIIVIDGNANIIPVVNGEFVMPDTRVRVEVIYKPLLNPQTFDTSVKFGLLTIGAAGIYFASKKYYRRYKKIFR